MINNDDKMMRDLYERDGLGLAELASLFGSSISTVRYRLLSHGVKMRRQGRPRRVLELVKPSVEVETC